MSQYGIFGFESIKTITGNTGGKISPIASNLNLLGAGGITVAGNNITGTLTISGAAFASQYDTDIGGPVFPVGGVIKVYGGNNITTNGTIAGTIVLNLTGTTNHAVQVGDALGSLNSLPVGTNGLVLTGNTGADPSWQPTLPGGINWTRETGDTIPMVVNHGYINTNVGLTAYTLPVTATLGTIIAVMGESSGGWQIKQNAGQSIQLGFVSTATGLGGGLQSVNQYDVVYLVCRVPDTTWSVSSSMGNILIA
jgi:hypothetical protein